MKLLWIVAGALSLAIVGTVCVLSLSGPLPNADFNMFWRMQDLAYPPPYLLVIKPFALLAYGAAFISWVTITGALYVWASRGSRLEALANPAATFNGMIGQNAFLTSAIMFAGLRDLSKKPVRSGAILGLLIIKPHLAIILPIAVFAARAWKAIPAALATISLLFATAFVAFGQEAYAHFFELSSKYGQFVHKGAWNWNELASFYAVGRWLGLDAITAGAVHAAIAVAAAFAVWLAWRKDCETKVALTAAAALLISPYLFTYDAVLLALALGQLRGPKALAVWTLLLIPLLRVFVHQDWPNTAPLAAGLAVAALTLQSRSQIIAQGPAPATV